MDLLNDSEAAERLRMLPGRLVRLARKGLVPHVLLPDGELRFDPRDLDAWVEAHKRPAPADHQPSPAT